VKENSREEDIKMIEILKNKNLYINIKPKSSICIDCINKNKNKHIEAEVVINEKLEEAINYILSDYKRVLKENEELKKFHIQDNKHLDFIMQHSIPVQKVKDQIEEYKNMLKTCNKAKDIDRIKAINERILELQELLEGRK
jgi:hypothetical protein